MLQKQKDDGTRQSVFHTGFLSCLDRVLRMTMSATGSAPELRHSSKGKAERNAIAYLINGLDGCVSRHVPALRRRPSILRKMLPVFALPVSPLP
jgi:hypothetical protein